MVDTKEIWIEYGIKIERERMLKLIDEILDEAIDESEIQNLELIDEEKEIGEGIIDLLKSIKKELKQKINGVKIPRCSICGKPMKNCVDSKTKKISKYLWSPDCECFTKGRRLSVG